MFYTCIMGSVGENYRCPLCGRTGHGGYAMDDIGYPVCTRAGNSCLNKVADHNLKPWHIVGAALREILKGTALYLHNDICENIGAFLTPCIPIPLLCWANDTILPRGSCLYHEQADEIYNEFRVCVTIRPLRAGQAKRLRVDRQCRILSMCGLEHNFDWAFARAMKFIDINCRLGGLPVGVATGDVALDNNTGNVSDEPGEEQQSR